MKIFCMHLKIFFTLFAVALVLGIITVTPCACGKKGSLLGRCFGVDSYRAKELCSMSKDKISSMCKK